MFLMFITSVQTKPNSRKLGQCPKFDSLRIRLWLLKDRLAPDSLLCLSPMLLDERGRGCFPFCL